MILEQYDGKVPDTMEDLLKLPDVGRKTAYLILGNVYYEPGVWWQTPLYSDYRPSGAYQRHHGSW